MALRGIDAQIMVTKSAELTGEHAKLLKQSEKQSEQAAVQTRREIGEDRKRAQAAGRVKGGRVTLDGQGPGGNYPSGAKARGKKRDKEDEAQADDLLQLPVEPEKPRAIDIII